MRPKKFLLGFVTVALMLCFIEGALHLFHFIWHVHDPDAVTNRMHQMFRWEPYQDKDWAHAQFKEFFDLGYDRGKFTAFEQYFMWKTKEYHGQYYNIDAQGLRKTWVPPPSPKMAKTVFLFGGSTVWGTAVRDDYTIPSYLAKIAHDHGRNMLVQNYGTTGYVFSQELVRLIDLLRQGQRPDYVIFYDGINDVLAAAQMGRAGKIHNYKQIQEKLENNPSPWELLESGMIGLCRDHSMIYKALHKIGNYLRPQKTYFEEYNAEKIKAMAMEIIDDYASNVNFLDRLSKAFGFKYFCYWQPAFFTESHQWSLPAGHLHAQSTINLFHQTYRQMETRHWPHFHNMADIFKNENQSPYIDAFHISEDGNKMVAQKIFELSKTEFL